MTLRERLRSATIRLTRRALAVRRASARTNTRVLRARAEDVSSLLLRDAVETDIPELAALHVRTWNDTYAPMMRGPPVAIREAQWREAFAKQDGSWFCIVAQRPDGALVAFAKGKLGRPDDPGQLDKVYIEREYQRLGIGRRLLGRVVRRFRELGVERMSAYVDPRNPSCGFFERLGGHWLVEDGRINFSWYVWNDLAALETACRFDRDGR